MIYATSDLHGYDLEAFQRLLDRVRFGPGDRLYIIGDVVDRNGDGGVAMLRWIMEQENVRLIRGNHEAMMLSCAFLFGEGAVSSGQERSLQRWLRNGARVTIRSLQQLKEMEPEELEKLLAFVAAAPLYAEVAVPMKKYLLVHGGLGNYAPGKPMSLYSEDELVWTRPDLTQRYDGDRTVIVGHTPTQYYGLSGRMLVTDTWIDIDTGAADGGHPMLLRLDDLMPFYAERA